jgi:chemotaxis protein histidine kinase CheA
LNESRQKWSVYGSLQPGLVGPYQGHRPLRRWRRHAPCELDLPFGGIAIGAIREGSLEGFVETLSAGLDELARGETTETVEAEDALWIEHGPAFVAEAKNRLARAQELVLGLENGAEADAVAELFRIVHTIKGEAAFLHQTELMNRAHRLEGRLDELRSGTLTLEAGVIDQLLAGVDALNAALAPASASPVAPTPENKVVHRESRPDQAEILRIPANKIDALVALVSELLVALESEAGEPSVPVKKLSRGLQQAALRLRTEPLKDLLGRIKRGVRDLSKSLDKPVEVVITGEELELDRNLIANLEEPLMHLVRNSMDHGIEAPDERLRAGKPRTATLRLAAQRRGNRIWLTVGDDGRGLDTDKIWTKALEKGLVTGEQPDDDALVHGLIFQPGFSTAETLTQVSGRGVGMDIVSSVVKANRGRVDLKSRPGLGTDTTMVFPLSTAVHEGLVVRSGAKRYVVPVNSAVETLRVDPGSLRTVAPGSRIFSLRGEALPVVSLDEALTGSGSLDATWGVVVETVDSGRHLLLVDEVEAKKEVVIRSLGSRFQHLRGVSAVTILAGGALAVTGRENSDEKRRKL